jgi:hypothetical protein
MNSQFADDIARALPESRILRQLETLDLSMGVLTDDGAIEMLEHKEAFRHLKKIDLSQNLLTDAGLKRIHALHDHVVTGEQREQYDEDDRYVAVGE